MDAIEQQQRDRFGLVSSPAWVLWVRRGPQWDGVRSSDDRDYLLGMAMGYASDRVRVLRMGQTPGED
ncbi:MAG: hypothetical protein JNM56_16460 [Planctomycetia bacterium]|nr:hypothetical protein [Planctomycetia bacterium]